MRTNEERLKALAAGLSEDLTSIASRGALGDDDAARLEWGLVLFVEVGRRIGRRDRARSAT